MDNAKVGLWRIEFDTDLTRSSSLIIPLGFLLDAEWVGHARGLGMMFRRRLMPLELDRVNRATWPELEAIEPFMKSLFAKAWDSTSTAVAANYSARSALRFTATTDEIRLGVFDRMHSIPKMIEALLERSDQLDPQITAPVIKMPVRKKVAARKVVDHADLHTVAEAA